MVITKEELKQLLEKPNADIEKYTKLSYDGKNLLTRIPKEIVEFLKLEKGNKVRWLVKSDTKIMNIEVLNEK